MGRSTEYQFTIEDDISGDWEATFSLYRGPRALSSTTKGISIAEGVTTGVRIPSSTPTPTSFHVWDDALIAPSPAPTLTPTPSPTLTRTPTPTLTATPVPLPTQTPTSAVTPRPTSTPVPTARPNPGADGNARASPDVDPHSYPNPYSATATGPSASTGVDRARVPTAARRIRLRSAKYGLQVDGNFPRFLRQSYRLPDAYHRGGHGRLGLVPACLHRIAEGRLGSRRDAERIARPVL